MLHILNYSAQTARLEGLDALRGFALMGILLVNFPEVVGVHEIRPDGQVYQWLDFLIEGHFFPLFCLLFAIGFGMMWRTAPLRTSRPRFALVRRLLLLGILGVLHSQLQPSEVLLLYALFGFFILIPMTFLPPAKWARWILFIIGALLIAVGGWVGGWMLIAGLFVVGFLAGQARIPERIASSTHTRRVSAFIALACAALSLFGFWLKEAVENGNASATPGQLPTLLMAAGYVAMFITLLRTPARRVLTQIFAPLGKMSLTNYITATLLMMVAKYLAPGGWWESGTVAAWITTFASCAVILAMQWAWSKAWQQRFGQGPLERVWRNFTWWGKSKSNSQQSPSQK